jgi:hypothetical protein
MEGTNAEIRAKISAYQDIMKKSQTMPYQKLLEHCRSQFEQLLKRLHNKTIANSGG